MTAESALSDPLQDRLDDPDEDERRAVREYVDELLAASRASVADELRTRVETRQRSR
jgi:hypothetical protein